MKLVFFAHPPFIYSASMPRFLNMLVEGMRERGHMVETWSPTPLWFKLPAPRKLGKWLGYIDQFLRFPREVKRRLKHTSDDTLFVFCDQALGPWVPLVADRPHVIHCHDFLALGSALGEWPQNPVSWTGKHYQRMIYRGFSRGRNFASVSNKTRDDLHRFLPREPQRSKVIYNGLNYPFKVIPLEARTDILRKLGRDVPEKGFIMHIGGNQWYKNRSGVLEIYAHYTRSVAEPLQLWMFGSPPSKRIEALATSSSNGGVVHFITSATDLQINAAYSSARVLLFPSIAEGFGWPIAEAMAAGCLVLTSGERPMNEVGGEAAHYLPRPEAGVSWASQSAEILRDMLEWPTEVVEKKRLCGLEQARIFSSGTTLDAYEMFYLDVLNRNVK